jgi:hypothetical protein
MHVNGQSCSVTEGHQKICEDFPKLPLLLSQKAAAVMQVEYEISDPIQYRLIAVPLGLSHAVADRM